MREIEIGKLKQHVPGIGHCDQKFCDWDLKLLQATQYLSQNPRRLAFSLISLILRLVALASNHIALLDKKAYWRERRFSIQMVGICK